MKVLVVGGGGREHAIVWRLAACESVTKIYCAPGNAGISELAECVDIDADDISALSEYAKSKNIDLTIVGPEKPLVDGIVDHFAVNGLLAFGPSAKAAKIEGSKVFAKSLMEHYGIPTARFDIFNSVEGALKFSENIGFPVVVKADGLAAGKGAVICRDRSEAEKALDSMLVHRMFGAAGDTVVVEEFLEGHELSVLAIVSGNDIVMLPTVQDHKAAFDGDEGPNTGGMGAYSPVPFVSQSELSTIERDVIIQTVHAMMRDGTPYCGVLYAGLILTKKGPYVLEFNCRFGDPEAQAILPRLKGDFAKLLLACARNKLSDAFDYIDWDNKFSVCVVMASEGYPGPYKKGVPIKGLNQSVAPDVHIFHAGTRKRGIDVVSTGGRVLSVTALGNSLAEARAKAYASVSKIEIDGSHYRTDIGRRERKE